MAKAQGGKQATGKAAAKKRIVKVESSGDAHIVASFNNIIISLTNKQGQVISWSSAGKMGFKGSKKNTPYAAQMAASRPDPGPFTNTSTLFKPASKATFAASEAAICAA